jgi:predicted O-methyltransferase YrrM
MRSVIGHFGLWFLGLAKPETQTSAIERACLVRHAVGRKRLAEIGVWHGVTTCLLRSAMAPDGVLFAVDPYPSGRLGFSTQQIIAKSGVRRIRNGEVLWLRTTGVGAANDRRVADLGVDYVFIDGDHSFDGLRRDWESWSPLILPGGIVCLHDSQLCPGRTTEDTGSVRYTREAICQDQRFHVIDVTETVTVLERVRSGTAGM